MGEGVVVVGRGYVVREGVARWVSKGDGVIFIGRGVVVGRVNGDFVESAIFEYRSDLSGFTGNMSGGGNRSG